MKARVAFFVVVAATAILAACGGGGGGGGIPSVTSTATPTPIASPASDSTSAPLSASTTTPVTFATISSGASATITLPAASVATTAKLSFQSALPTGVATPSLRALKSRAVIGGSNLTTLALITLSVTSTISIASTPAFSFTFPSAPSGDAYVAYYDENNAAGGWTVLLGPGTASGNTISFTAQRLAPPLVLAANDTYVFAMITSGSLVTPQPISITGSIAQTDSFNYPTPSPFPSTSQSGTVTESVVVGSSPFPGSAAGVIVDYRESDAIAYPLATSTSLGDYWYASAPSVASTLYEFLGSQITNSASTVTSTIYKSGQIEDELPETNGATWTNSPAATVSTGYADGAVSFQTINADGSYAEGYVDPFGYTLSIASSANGSGTYSGTEFSAAYAIDGYSMAAPSGGSIIVSIVPTPAPSGQPSAQPFPIATPVAWFTPTPTGLYNETDTLTTGVSYPASCSVPSGFGTSGSHIATAITRIDPVIGTLDNETIDTYTSASFGPVCQILHDTTVGYYDFALDVSHLIADFSGSARQTTTLRETLTLQSSPLSVQVLLHARAQFEYARALQRGERVRALAIHLRSLALQRGGLK